MSSLKPSGDPPPPPSATASSSSSSSPSTTPTRRLLAKRSILGSRVAAPGDDGKLYPAVIQAVKTSSTSDNGGEGLQPSSTSGRIYAVRFDDGSRQTREFPESELVGPGFPGGGRLRAGKLKPGQIVYVTHANREVQGAVMHHRPNIDQVIIRILVSHG